MALPLNLPPNDRSIGDTDHTTHHNMIVDALAELEAVAETSLVDTNVNPADLDDEDFLVWDETAGEWVPVTMVAEPNALARVIVLAPADPLPDPIPPNGTLIFRTAT